ncbi:hypothetical protein DNTS_001952 [Danionella cerebrum]|uniref:CUE domain-containing protein n=1 Tax=Danionella cerebrum TaxID=2873325 RepID=A0A553R184_9TELE|nr:hypothetical protein DNTS_001952 [Danionella translucida]TRY95946.1 hypothetical protein DNTS_001952 [Danionella translucida]
MDVLNLSDGALSCVQFEPKFVRMDLQKIIHDALYDFISSYIPHADLSTLDDVLLSYITGVLEDLGSQKSVEENFDVEVFVEMLEAYIPGFSNIDSVKVCEMMFSLASKLTSARDTELGKLKIQEEKCAFTETHALNQGGSREKPLDFCRQAEGATAQVNYTKTISAEVDQKLKASILEKYMMVDSEEDKKVHRPVTPRDAPKKMVRYHGSQVVTTKGERYHQVKKEETDDMKKTYVSLKPARKYRFH